MNYPNVWGAGALFAYSGLHDECTPERAMCGRLMGDFIGVDFDAHDLQLLLRLRGVREWRYDVVASDLIAGELCGKAFSIAFVAQDTVVGRCPEQATPTVHADLLRREAADEGLLFCGRGVWYAFCRELCWGEYHFALVRDGDGAEAMRRARQALHRATDETISERKLAYFRALPLPEGLDDVQTRTLYKCFSVMKSQVMSPSGKFPRRWTTPDRLPHRHLWLWDSVFHALGNVYVSPDLARDTLLSVLDAQREDGFVPHMVTPTGASDVTQPPVLAWGLWCYYEQTGDSDTLCLAWERLRAYLAWNEAHRAGSVDGLFSWYVDPSDPHCRCGESGMDNSPRFDGEVRLDCVDFSCFMANEMRSMECIAAVLGQQEAGEEYRTRYERICEAIETQLYCERDGRYYDRGIESGEVKRVAAVSCFLPLFAGVCSAQRAAVLLADLHNPETFGTALGVPSVARSDATYGTDMWRGPVWINYNYMIMRGLEDYGYAEEAQALRERTLAAVERWYERDGCIYEFYDCENDRSPALLPRKGAPLRPRDDTARYPAICDYGWSACLYAAMRCERLQR